MATELSAAAGPLRMLLAPLAVPDYRLLWSSAMAGRLADVFQTVALSAAAIEATRRASGWAGVLVVMSLPAAILTPLGGLLSDLLGPRRVMLIALVMQAIAAAVLAAWCLRAQPTLFQLIAYALATGTLSALLVPAAFSIVVDTLPATALRGGNALSQTTFSLARLIGAPVAGVVMATAGPATALAVTALCFAAAAASVYGMRAGARGAARLGGRPPLGEGFRALRSDRGLAAVARSAALFFIGYTTVIVGLPSFATLTLGGRADAIGVLYGAIGGGMLVGALAGGSLPPARGHARTFRLASIAIAASGLLVTASGAASSVTAAAAAVAAASALAAAGLLAFVTEVQARVAPEVRGRVLSWIAVAAYGVYPLSYAAAGWAGDRFGARALVLGGGALLFLSGAAAFVGGPLRRLASPQEET